MSAEGPTKAALRDVMVAKSEHLRPPQDRLRPTAKAFENTMRQPLLEYDRSSHPFRQQLITRPLQMVDGWVDVPAGPGLGVEVDRAVLEAFRV